MKVIVTESRIGIEYLSDVISTCDQNGIECIVDDKAGDILYYEPKLGKYGNDKLLQNSDESIFDLVKDKERLASVLKDAQGDEFKEFAVQWNDLQKKGDDDEVYKTQHCNPIRGNFSEKRRDWESSEDEVEVQWLIDDSELGIASGSTETFVIDLDMVDDFQDLIEEVKHAMEINYGSGAPFEYDDEWVFTNEDALMKRFGYSVDESGDDPRDWSASEGEVEIIWDTDEYEDFGIFSGDTSHYVIDYDRVDTHDDLINEVCRLIGKEYPDLDFDPSDFVIANEDEFWGDEVIRHIYPYDESGDSDVASVLAEELGVDAKRDVVEKEDGEYDYFSPEHTFGVKLPDGTDATYIVYDNEESATTSASDDLGEKFQDDAPIFGAAIEYFGIDSILKYISGLDQEETDELVSLYDDLDKEEFAEYIQNRVGFDYRGFAEFNINELGPAWHLAEYDGQELELPNGMLAYRVD